MPLWRRHRRRSLAPRRPAVFPEQWSLVVVALAVIVASIAGVVLVLAR